MDLSLFIIFLVVSFGLGILVVKDRIFGIGGILVGFIGATSMYQDGSLSLYTICDPSSIPCQWISYSINGTNTIWLFVVVIIIDVLLLYSENNKYRPTDRYTSSETFGNT